MPAGADAIRATLARGFEHHRAGRLAEAEAAYRAVLEEEPANADALHHLGLIAFAAKEHARAIDLMEAARALQPDDHRLLSNLAEVYLRADRTEEALACGERAVELQPDSAAAHMNVGNALRRAGRLDEAERALSTALALEPASARGKVNLGFARLQRGDYASGFELFESRFEIPAFRERGDTSKILSALKGIPCWRGEPLHGKRLLLWTEQGLGDSVMMLRFLPELRRLGAARVLMCCESALARLIENSHAVDEIGSSLDAVTAWRGAINLHCPLMSLPFALKVMIDSIPATVPYVEVPSELQRRWAERLAALASPRVGVVWASGNKSDAGSRRSIPFDAFAPLFALRGVRFVSLQKERDAAVLKQAVPALHDFMDECGDLLDTAALMTQLDLVISVDTVVPHLAGALGKPVWLLKRTHSEWRWMNGRTDTPWYPAMRIFGPGNFDSQALISEVCAALQAQFNLPSASGWGRLGRWLSGRLR